MIEADIMRLVQKKATELGARLWRNNQGAYKDGKGNYIKYGVQNPGGSDLIGIIPVKIEQHMVGTTIGAFVAIETKTEKGKATKDQQTFLDFIASFGGVSGIARSEEDLVGILQMQVRTDDKDRKV